MVSIVRRMLVSMRISLRVLEGVLIDHLKVKAPDFTII